MESRVRRRCRCRGGPPPWLADPPYVMDGWGAWPLR